MKTGQRAVDLGTKERHKRGMGVEVGARVVTAGGVVVHDGAKAVAECILDGMLRMGMLEGIEGGHEDRKAVAQSRYLAGMRYRQIFEDAGLNTVQAMDLEAKAQGGAGEIPSNVAHKRKHFNEVTGKLGAYKFVMQNVCCYNQTPSDQAIINQTKTGLDRLCLILKL